MKGPAISVATASHTVAARRQPVTSAYDHVERAKIGLRIRHEIALY
jgi:hypothetical protein